MPRKTAIKKTSTGTRRKTRSAAKKTMSDTERAEAAYYNWLNRGTPLWDDQTDWFAAGL